MSKQIKTQGFSVGIDENGLGPLLGPLLVTAITAQGPTNERVPSIRHVGDSKLLVGFGHSALGEAWARALLEQQGTVPHSPAELVDLLLGESGTASRGLCPGGHAPQCWRDEQPWDASDALVEQVGQSMHELERAGWRLTRARSEHVCTRELNTEEAAGRSRLHMNLGRMERLIVDARAHAPGPLNVTCGKVGGMRYYVPQLRHLHAILTHSEEAAASRYELSDGTKLEFLRDAESQRPLVALASLIGKYLRDRIMRRICAFHGATSASDAVSGYHDPRTLRFVQSTRDARTARSIQDSCFLRFGKKGAAIAIERLL